MLTALRILFVPAVVWRVPVLFGRRLRRSRAASRQQLFRNRIQSWKILSKYEKPEVD